MKSSDPTTVLCCPLCGARPVFHLFALITGGSTVSLTADAGPSKERGGAEYGRICCLPCGIEYGDPIFQDLDAVIAAWNDRATAVCNALAHMTHADCKRIKAHAVVYMEYVLPEEPNTEQAAVLVQAGPHNRWWCPFCWLDKLVTRRVHP